MGSSISWQHSEGGIICFKSKEAEFREAESLIRGHTVREWQRQSVTPGDVDPRARFFSIKFYKVNKFYQKEKHVKRWK